jgi:hypothetical protein
VQSYVIRHPYRHSKRRPPLQHRGSGWRRQDRRGLGREINLERPARSLGGEARFSLAGSVAPHFRIVVLGTPRFLAMCNQKRLTASQQSIAVSVARYENRIDCTGCAAVGYRGQGKSGKWPSELKRDLSAAVSPERNNSQSSTERLFVNDSV